MSQIPPIDGPSIPPKDGGAPEQLVILLHGIGADGNDLIGLAPLYQRVLPKAFFVSPNAPFRFDMAPFGYQWFSLQNYQPNTRLVGVQGTAPVLDAFIDSQLDRWRLNESDLVLIGFSQGAMMALHVGLRRETPLAGIIAHSGMLVGEELLAEEIKSRPPILLTHGAIDEVLPVQALSVAEVALKNVGVDVTAHVMPELGHGIDENTILFDLRFLAEVFNVRGDAG
jgi:phospholipase/carboxylesterase